MARKATAAVMPAIDNTVLTDNSTLNPNNTTSTTKGTHSMKISITKDAIASNNTVPPGLYKVSVTGHKVRTSQTGNLVIAPEFTITTQEAPDGTKVHGRKLFGNWTITEAAIGIVNTGYKALTGTDLPLGDLEIDELVNVITSNIQGKECLLDVELRPNPTNPEQMFNNIKKFVKIS